MNKIIINKKQTSEEFFLDYINFLEGIKTYCKSMHWGIMNVNISNKRGGHLYLDDFLNIISDYQDMISETTQGILGNYITTDNVKGKVVPIEAVKNNLHDLCQWILDNVFTFYNSLNTLTYVGIKAETETFIKDIQRYIYLFNLCS